MTAVIQTEKLTKSYGAQPRHHRGRPAVNEGEVFGFLGPNGAGKTTTIRTILDLIRPTSRPGPGLRHRVVRRPGRHPPPDRLHPGRVHALRPPDRRPDARVLREPPGRRRSGLPGVAHRALRPRPDAPLQGVLQGQQAEGRPGHRAPAPARAAHPRRADLGPRPARPADVLRARPRGPDEGRTVFLSSHILSEVERTADRVAIIREGRIVKVDSVEGLRDLAHHQVELRFAGRSRPTPSSTCRASATSSPTTTCCACAWPGRSRRSSGPPPSTSCSTS